MTPSEREEIEKVAEEMVKYVFDCVQNGNSSMAHQFVESSILTQVAKARAEEREKLAQFMLARSFATGHGDTIEDLLKELDWNINNITEITRDEALEEAAKIAIESESQYCLSEDEKDTTIRIAEAIRRRLYE